MANLNLIKYFVCLYLNFNYPSQISHYCIHAYQYKVNLEWSSIVKILENENLFPDFCLESWSYSWEKLTSHYASPSSGEAYRDRRLTTNFELWVEIFCVPTCFHMRIPKLCLSVRTPRKDIIIASSISVLH